MIEILSDKFILALELYKSLSAPFKFSAKQHTHTHTCAIAHVKKKIIVSDCFEPIESGNSNHIIAHERYENQSIAIFSAQFFFEFDFYFNA